MPLMRKIALAVAVVVPIAILLRHWLGRKPIHGDMWATIVILLIYTTIVLVREGRSLL
jgi:hypothetical protein